MQANKILTTSQAADILRINENTVKALAVAGKIPHFRVPSVTGDEPYFRFNTADVANWLQFGPELGMNDEAYLERLKKRWQEKFPEALAKLHEFDKHFIAPRKAKGYNLSKVASKKLGFVYHVRYIEKGKLVPTRWSTHTNDEDTAIKFALDNRARLLDEYRRSKADRETATPVYDIMEKYYKEDSEYLKKDAVRGRTLGEQTRKTYHNSIINHWIPFLKERKIKTLEEIDAPLLARFQDHCLAKGVKPQTINHYVSFVSNIFDHLLIRGQVKTNPCAGISPLHVGEDECEVRGCYNVSELKGVFNKIWDDELSYLLCLVIYSTGMRNSEMDRIQVKDIVQKGKHRFINITKSKTRFGARLVPLHNFVYVKLLQNIEKNNKGPDDLLFCQKNGKPLPRQNYTDANLALGKFTRPCKGENADEKIKRQLEKENITFYSGRHFWKTLMNNYDLGEVEEYFMGHKVSNDVAKRYNHRDKQGEDRLISKAGEVFSILDKGLFR